MATVTPTRSGERPAPTRVLPLESGDRLTSAEFERRYTSRPDIRRAELIEGVVYVASPMHHDLHGSPQRIVSTWLGTYQAEHPETDGGDGSTIRLDPENNVQPDSFLRYRDGSSRVTTDDYIEGAPELVFEIAASSAAVDLGPKLRAYRRNGVLEYLVWQLYENRLDWFARKDGEFISLEPDERGVIHSVVFPGLRLAVTKLLDRDLAGVLKEQNRKRPSPR
jgi:Uma2 family endonuclease